MTVGNFLYRSVLKRNSVMVAGILVGSLYFEKSFDHFFDNLFFDLNKGKLFRDLKIEAKKDE